MTSISMNDLLDAYKDQLAEAHYTIAVLRAQLGVHERAQEPAKSYDTHPELATSGPDDPTPPA